MTTLLRRGLILLLAGLLMLLMSATEVRHYLGHESARTVLLYLNGIDHSITPDALVGSAPLNHPQHHFDARGLTLRDTGRAAQLSLRLPVTPIDTRLLRRLTLLLTASDPGEWIAYLRQSAEGPIVVSQTRRLGAGEQELTLDLEQIIASASNTDQTSDWRLSEIVLAPYYPEAARITIHHARWQPGNVVHPDDWRIVSAQQLGTLPGQQLNAFQQGRQANPLLLAPDSSLSLMALPHWISLSALLLLTASALLIDWRLRRMTARFLWLVAIVGSVALFDFRGLYQAQNIMVICALLLIVLYPMACYAARRWRLIQWHSAGDWRVLTGILLLWGACLLWAWSQSEISGMQLLRQWLSYLPWALAQQLILLGGLLPLCQQPSRSDQRTSPAGHSRFLNLPAALLFGWLHYPNLLLMAGSAGLAALIMLLWHRGHGWLVTLSLHATVGTLALGMAPEHWLLSGDIGSLWLG